MGKKTNIKKLKDYLSKNDVKQISPTSERDNGGTRTDKILQSGRPLGVVSEPANDRGSSTNTN